MSVVDVLLTNVAQIIFLASVAFVPDALYLSNPARATLNVVDLHSLLNDLSA